MTGFKNPDDKKYTHFFDMSCSYREFVMTNKGDMLHWSQLPHSIDSGVIYFRIFYYYENGVKISYNDTANRFLNKFCK